MVKNLYNECMALEELLEEAVNALGPDARDILAQVRCGALMSLPPSCVKGGLALWTGFSLFSEQLVSELT